MPLFLSEIVNVDIPTLFSKHHCVPLHEVEVIKKAFKGQMMQGKEVEIRETGEFEPVDSDVEYRRLVTKYKYPNLVGSPFEDSFGRGAFAFEATLEKYQAAAHAKQELIKLSRASCENTTLDYLVAKEQRKASKPWPLEKMGPKTVEALKALGIENSADLGAVLGESADKIGDLQKLARILAMPGATKATIQIWREIIFAD